MYQLQKSVANLQRKVWFWKESGMDLSVQGMYELQEKCRKSVSSRYSYVGSGMNLSAHELQENCCESVSSRYSFGYREWNESVSTRYVSAAKKVLANLSAQGMVGSGMNLSAQGVYQLQEKCRKSVSSRYGFGYREWHGSVSTRYVSATGKV